MNRMLLAILCVVGVCGCATMQLELAKSTYSSYCDGTWFEVNPAITNAPSGTHLHGLLSAVDASVRRLVSEHGAPDWVASYKDLNSDAYGHEGKPSDIIKLAFTNCNLYVDKVVNNNYANLYKLDAPWRNVTEKIHAFDMSLSRDDSEHGTSSCDDAIYDIKREVGYILEGNSRYQRMIEKLPLEYVAYKNQQLLDAFSQKEAELDAFKIKVDIEINAKRRAEEKARQDAASQQARLEDEARNKETAEANKLFDLDALKQRAEAQKARTLVFKNFYIGMPITDCLQMINNLMGLRQTLPAPSLLKSASDEISMENVWRTALAASQVGDQSEPYRVHSREGKQYVAQDPYERPFAVADDAGLIVRFQLNRNVIAKLFGASGMPTDEFLRLFVNAYDLSGLSLDQQKVTATVLGTTREIGRQNVYRHRNSKGYEVAFYDDAVIFDEDMKDFADTPECSMIIKKIETAKAREAKFD